MKNRLLKSSAPLSVALVAAFVSTCAWSSSTLIDQAREQEKAGNARAALDLYWQYVKENPSDIAARLSLANAYEAAGFVSHAKTTRDSAVDGRLGAYRDILGHSRTAHLMTSKPKEGTRFYWRTGIGWDDNPTRAVSDYAQAYSQTYGVTPVSTPAGYQSQASAALGLGFGSNGYYRINDRSGLYLNGDLGMSKYPSFGTADNYSVVMNTGYALHDAENHLRIGPRYSWNKFPDGPVPNYSSLGLGLDYSRRLNGDSWVSGGVGWDKSYNSHVSAADFNRFSAYLAYTKAWATPWRPHAQVALSSTRDTRAQDTLTNSNVVTGPDRHELGVTISGQIRPTADWTLHAIAGYAQGADDSPFWSTPAVQNPNMERWSFQLGASYTLNPNCAAFGRIGTHQTTSQAAFNSYKRNEISVGASCWID